MNFQFSIFNLQSLIIDCRLSFITLLTFVRDWCAQGSRRQYPSDDHIDEKRNLSCRFRVRVLDL